LAKVEVDVTTRAREPGVAGRRGEVLKVRVSAPPEDGRANQELIKIVASFLGVPRSTVSVALGGAARHKVLEVEGLTMGDLAAALARAQPLDS